MHVDDFMDKSLLKMCDGSHDGDETKFTAKIDEQCAKAFCYPHCLEQAWDVSIDVEGCEGWKLVSW